MGKTDRAALFRHLDRLYRDGTATAQNDTHLLDRFLLDRDEAAFESIVTLHGPMVLALCRRFLRDPRDIEDAFQATFLVLVRKAGSIRDRRVLASWLYGVAYRVAVRARSDVLRRRSTEAAVPLLESLPDATVPSTEDVAPVLDQEVNRLPEKYRAPIVLCYLKEQTHDQAAAVLRWPVGTVRSRLARGRALLRDRLTRRGYAPVSALLGVGPAGLLPSFTAAVPEPLVQATVSTAGRFLGGAAVAGPAVLGLSSTLSGSAATLARGVLTTMALSQIKLIGAGVVAASLLAGGAGSWALSAAHGPGDQEPPPTEPRASALPQPAPKPSASLQPAPKPPTLPQPVTAIPPHDDMIPPSLPPLGPSNNERLDRIEKQLSVLLQYLAANQPRQAALAASGFPTTEIPVPVVDPAVPVIPGLQHPDLAPRRVTQPRPSTTSPVRPTPGALAPPAEEDELQPPLPSATERSPFEMDEVPVQKAPSASARTMPARNPQQVLNSVLDTKDSLVFQRSSIRETEAQIRSALLQLERNKALFQSGVLGKDKIDETFEQLRRLVGRLEDWDQDLSEEAERLQFELVKKSAEIKVAEAQHDATQATAARNERLNERKKGMVSSEDLALAASQNAATLAALQVKMAESKEVGVRLAQLERRRAQIREILDRVRKSVPELEPR